MAIMSDKWLQLATLEYLTYNDRCVLDQKLKKVINSIFNTNSGPTPNFKHLEILHKCRLHNYKQFVGNELVCFIS